MQPNDLNKPTENLNPAPSQNADTPLGVSLDSQMPVDPQPTVNPDGLPSKASHKVLYVLLALVAIIVAAAAAAYFLMNTTKKDDNAAVKAPIKIGIISAFTTTSTIGFDVVKGVDLAKKQLGADEVTVVRADSQCSKEKAKAAFDELAKQGVVAIIGDSCSVASGVAMEGANAKKIPMISPTSSSPTLTKPDDYFFRVIPSDDYQAPFMAKAMIAKGIKRAAIIFSDEAYGNNLSQKFKEAFTEAGGTVAATLPTDPNGIDFSAPAAAVKNAKVDGVFFVVNSSVSSTAALKTVRAVNPDVKFFGGDSFADTSIVADAGAAAEGMIITNFAAGSQQFRQQMYAEYSLTADAYGAAQSYDAFQAIYKAIQSGAKSGEEIKKALENISFEGVTGKIAFNKDGELDGATYKYDLMRLSNGKIERDEE